METKEMQKYVIVYTDVPWVMGHNGIVDPSLANIERSVLGDKFELRFVPTVHGHYQGTSSVVYDTVAGADAIVINRCVVTSELLDAAGENLKVVARQGVGYENLSAKLLKKRGIIGFNVPDYCVDEVATHTLALLLALERGLIIQHATLANGKFDIFAGNVPRRLQNYTAGIVGFGRIGRVVSSRLRIFYRGVIAYDPYVTADLMAAYGVTKVSFEELLGVADVILVHCLLTEETALMFNSKAFSRMKPTSIFINVSRGGIVEAQGLYEALRSGTITGAGLDVFDPEDPHNDQWYSQIVKLSNVIVSSHRAFLSKESQVSQRMRTVEDICQVLTTGRPPESGHLT